MRLSKAARTTKATSLLASKNLGTLELYDGAAPATVDAALGAQNLIATFALPNPAGAIVNGVFTANAIASITAGATGTVSWYRQVDPDTTTVMQDGSVTASGGGGDMIIDNVNVVNGQAINLISWTETEGNAD